MVKLTVLVIVIIAIWMVFRAASRSRDKASTRSRAAENMVSCAHCGLNMPLSDAVESDGRYFCGEEHRRFGGR